MKKRISVFLTSLLVFLGCMGFLGCIKYMGNIFGETADLLTVTAEAAGTTGAVGTAGASASTGTVGTAGTSASTGTAGTAGASASTGTVGTVGASATTGTVGTSASTGRLLVADEANLLSEEEKARLIEDYSVITEYMGAAFISTDYSPGTTSSYAEQCAIRYYQNDPAVLFLIDMEDREIYVYANGTAQKTISKADARAITDNIYKSASRGEYYECADGAFRQIYAKCTGRKLARPVKHITNALIAVLVGILINYFITVYSRTPKAERRTKGEIKASVSSRMAHMPGIALGAAIVLDSVKHYKSSGSGGGGGGGGGHSGGGGGHGF